MSIRNLFLFLIFTLSLKGSAQLIQNPYFKHLNVEELGLKSAGFQHWDSKGQLWLVTDKGLVVYNGYQTHLVAYDSTNPNTPLQAKLRSIQATDTDEFWITYHGHHGLSKFDPVKMEFRHYLMDSLNRFMLPPVDIVKMVKANDSTFWIPTWGYGICKLNAKTGAVRRYLRDPEKKNSARIPSNYVKEMVSLPDGRYLVGFFDEPSRTMPGYFDPATGLYERYPIEPYLEKLNEHQKLHAIIGLTVVNFIYPDTDQNLWIGTYIGVFKLDQKTQTISRVSVPGANLETQNLENARNYIIDERGNMWIGTPNKGIMMIDLKSATASYIRHQISNNSSLSDDRILSMNKDPEGSIWISTGGGSFSIYFPVLQQFMLHPWSTMNLEYTDASLQKIPVNQMLVLENGHVLISSETGMIEYDPATRKTVQEFQPQNLKKIPRIAGTTMAAGIYNFRKIGDEIHTHLIWKHKPSEWDFYPVHFNLHTSEVSVYPEPNKHRGMLFRHQPAGQPQVYVNAGKTFTLFVFDTETASSVFEFTFPDSIGFSEVFSFPLKSGRWMISEQQGRFIIFDPKEKSYELYSHKSKDHFFPDSAVTCAYPDADGTVWIGTQNGLYRFDETTGKSEKQNAKIGLQQEEIVNAIIRDNDHILWVALSKDLIRWDQEKNHVFRFDKSFGLECGSFMPSVAQKDSSGNIYIASINGILTFDPGQLIIPLEPFMLFTDHVWLFDSLVSNDVQQKILSGKKSFRHDENYLTFSFTTNQVFPLSAHTFQYKLKGRDESWQNNETSNTIRLADLSYGDYVLEVKAIDSFKRESNIVQIPFTINRPFWLTWWFYSIMLVVAVLFIFYFVKYRERALRKRSIELESMVTERTADVVREKKEADKQRLEAEHQKEIVEEKQKEISDSINYAKRIQNAILPSNRFFMTHLPASFILYLPKDIVAGDFYFMENAADVIILGVADCTGHGVPGAMVSVVCHNALTRSVKEFGLTMPHQILDKTRELVLETFAKSEDQVNDGMDIALCAIDRKKNVLYFSGANNGLFLFRNNELTEFKPDKQPIGKFIHAKPFSVLEIPFEKDDQFYLFSDGYADQFGGEAGKPGGKKFKYSRLKTLLQEIHLHKPAEQQEILLNRLIAWRGEIEQVDDVCIVGFKAS